jgi:hypothetical protein
MRFDQAIYLRIAACFLACPKLLKLFGQATNKPPPPPKKKKRERKPNLLARVSKLTD